MPAAAASRSLPTRLLAGLRSPHAGGRFAALDGYRAVAAIAVVVYHVSGANFSTMGTTLSARALNGLGNLGVTIFFLLSGFLLFRPFVESHLRDTPAPNLRRYLRHRLLRIFPAYWLVLTAMLIVLPKSRMLDPTRPLTVDQYLSYYTLTMNMRPSLVFGGLAVAWTLHLEVAFYLLLPLIALGIRAVLGRRAFTAWQRMRANLIGLGILFTMATLYRLVVLPNFERTLDTQDHWLFNYLDWFALGMLLAVGVAWKDVGGRLPAVIERAASSTTACWVACIPLYVLYIYTSQEGPNLKALESTGEMFMRFLVSGVIALVLLLPVTIGERRRDPIRRALSSHVALYLGTISYGIYLWHTVVRDLLLNNTTTGAARVPHAPSFWILFPETLGLSIILASASWFLLEKPLMRYRNPRPKGPAAPATDWGVSRSAEPRRPADTEGSARPAPTPAEAAPERTGAVPTRAGAVPTRAGAVPKPVGAVPKPAEAIPTRAGAVPKRAGAVPKRAGAVPTSDARSAPPSPE